jgi:site-specific recombinase XerD
VDAFFASLGSTPSKSRNRRAATSAKSRNHHRAAIRQFLQWSVRKDYLPANHRLTEADGMRPENGNTAEVEFYTPAELKALLDAATGPMRAMLAIGGLAGLRTAELLRLMWEDNRTADRQAAAVLASLRNLANGIYELARERGRTKVDTLRSWCQRQTFTSAWPLLQR